MEQQNGNHVSFLCAKGGIVSDSIRAHKHIFRRCNRISLNKKVNEGLREMRISERSRKKVYIFP